MEVQNAQGQWVPRPANMPDSQFETLKAQGRVRPAAATAKPAPPANITPQAHAANTDDSSSVLGTIADIAKAGYEAPGVIAEGFRRDPSYLLSRSAIKAVAPNTYEAARDGRYLSMMGMIPLDAAQLALSPLKLLRLGLTASRLPYLSRFAQPTIKTSRLGTNLARNAISEATTGAADNIIYEGITDAIDDRDHGVSDYLTSGILGALAGGITSPLLARQQQRAIDNYNRWVSPSSHKNVVKENIRNVQNDTRSNLETLSRMVNESSPLATMSRIESQAEERADALMGMLGRYKRSPEGNAPMPHATIQDYHDQLIENLYRDNSGNLSRTEKDLTIQNFIEESTDFLMSGSPSLKSYLETNSQTVLGNPRAYLTNPGFVELAMRHYNLTPNDLNLLRQTFQNRSTLPIPAKAGYVRAGLDNRNYNEYYKLFKENIETNPDAQPLNDLNKRFSVEKNRAELANTALKQQGTGGILDFNFPYFSLNPEVNPTIAGNTALKARNLTNMVAGGAKDVASAPAEEKEEYYRLLAAIVADAKKLGIKTNEGIANYVAQRLTGDSGIPAMETIGTSEQRSKEK